MVLKVHGSYKRLVHEPPGYVFVSNFPLYPLPVTSTGYIFNGMSKCEYEKPLDWSKQHEAGGLLHPIIIYSGIEK